MTRVALFVPTLGGGGAERVFVTLANALAGRCVNVDLLATDTAGPYRAEVDARVRVVDLQTGRVHLSLLPLIRYLRRARPDALL
jgi:hypothetical protein